MPTDALTLPLRPRADRQPAAPGDALAMLRRLEEGGHPTWGDVLTAARWPLHRVCELMRLAGRM